MSLLTLALLSTGAKIKAQEPVEARLEATLAKMTLEEKITILGGDRSMFIRPLARLNLPELKMSDGPVGVRTWGPTTAFPAGACLAATWNPNLETAFGNAIGRDARARGVNIWLAPGVNLARIPQNGRNFEYQGEDPYLVSRGAVALIRAVQAQGVAATVKHYAANDHENDRNKDSSEVDERTMREIYLRPFEAAVREADVACVMSGYNRLNGVYCSENPWLAEKVLKGDWGFQGVFMTDWGACHSTLGAFTHGLDLEMPDPTYLNQKTLKPLLDSGKITVQQLDEKVRRILRLTYRFGFPDRPQLIPSIPKTIPPTPRSPSKSPAREPSF